MGLTTKLRLNVFAERSGSEETECVGDGLWSLQAYYYDQKRMLKNGYRYPNK